MGSRICIMNGGKVVQVGAPLDVYQHPANTFVAAFLGNPPMNLLPGRATGEHGGLTVQIGEATIVLPSDKWAPLPAGTAITLGIRPESVSEQVANGGGFATVPAEIVQVELLGAETILAARIPGVERDVMARVGATSKLKVGARCTLSLDLSAIHLFDAAGDALAHKA